MNRTASTAASVPHALLRKLGRLSRFIVFLCTSGWLFPHACTEDMDLTQIQNDRIAGKS
jgi:hypothetical protein